MMATRSSSFVKKKKEGRRECLVSKKSLSFILCYFLAPISPISCCCHRFTCAAVHCVPTIPNKRYGYDVLSLVDRRSNNRWTKMMISLYINEGNNGRRKSHLELRGGDGGNGSSEHHTYSGHESQHSYATTNRGGKASLSIPPSKEQNVESAAKSNEQSPFEYIPITALNEYGQSTQLRNAMESASRFGTPVLACICCHDDKNDAKNQSGEKVENAIVVCSLQRQRPGVISPSPSTNSVLSITTSTNKSSTSSRHSSIQGMVRLLAARDDIHPNSSKSCIADNDDDDDIPKHTLHTAIVTTGIQSDANFLITQLQTHISRYWFRYDTLPSTSSSDTLSSSSSSTVTKMVRDVLLDCLGYDWSNEVGSGKISGGIGSAAPSYNTGQDDNDDDDNNSPPTRAGRPLGICTFLLGLDSTATTHPYLTVVKANGASQQYVAHAMGVGSALGNDCLSQQWKRGMNRNEAVGMMKNVLKDIAKEHGWWTSDDDDDDDVVVGSDAAESGLTVVCETVTSSGIDIEFSPL